MIRGRQEKVNLKDRMELITDQPIVCTPPASVQGTNAQITKNGYTNHTVLKSGVQGQARKSGSSVEKNFCRRIRSL